MGWAEAGSGTQRAASGAQASSNSFPLAYPGNVTAGDFLLVIGSGWAVGGALTYAITDTLGTSYTITVSAALTGDNANTFIAWGIAPSSGANTVTVDPNNTADFSFSIDAFTGAHASPVSVDGGRTEGTSTSATDSLTTAVDNELVVAVCTYLGADTTLAAGANFTQIGQTATNTGNQAHIAEFRIVTTAGAYSAPVTLGASRAWSVQTYSFKPAAASGTTLTPAAGTLTLAGPAPVLARAILPAAGALTFTGQAPTLGIAAGQVIVTPGAGSLAFAGPAPALRFNFAITPPTGSLALVGTFPEQLFNGPDTAVLTLVGQAPVLARGMLVPAGALTLVGPPPTVLAGAGVILSPGTRALALTGTTPTVFVQVVIAVPTGSLTWSSIRPLVMIGGNLQAPPTSAGASRYERRYRKGSIY